jgi:hypothetical protein
VIDRKRESRVATLPLAARARRAWRQWNAKNALALNGPITRANWRFVASRAAIVFLLCLALGLAALAALLAGLRTVGPLPVLLIGISPTAYTLGRRQFFRRDLAALGYRVGFPRCVRLWHEGIAVAAKHGNARTFAELRGMLPPRDEVAGLPEFANAKDDAALILKAMETLAETAAGNEGRA